MSGTKALLDSNSIIYISKGLIDAEELLADKEENYVSIITYIEVYAYDFADFSEKDAIDEIFKNLEIVELDRTIAEQTIEYRKNAVKKIKLPDAAILATAKVIGADLITNNLSDFENIDDSITLTGIDTFKV
ncbi:MAG: type II toxin-antitoxin system VapC family toxin [Acidobacteria bacterium]|nr:type II toxin-antitoxin system VapC family toxin [Acidobacteriota bacterium]